MQKTLSSPKAVQAGDYGKDTPQTDKKPENTNTDGRKTLALWGKA